MKKRRNGKCKWKEGKEEEERKEGRERDEDGKGTNQGRETSHKKRREKKGEVKKWEE